MVDVDDIEKGVSETLEVQQQQQPKYDHDDIHQAALADNPTKAEALSWSTLFSIGVRLPDYNPTQNCFLRGISLTKHTKFLGLSIVPPIACGFIVATSVLYYIGSDLGNLTDLGWVVSGWSIASSVSFSLAGSLSDIFGRRNVILTGQFISLIGSIVAAVAPTLEVLIAGSTLLGFSCGFILVTYAAVPEIVANKYRGLGLAWIEGSLTIPWVAIAFLLGNLLILHSTWRWIYRICIIYSAVCLVGTAVFYFPPPRPRNDFDKTRLQEVMELDFIGIFLYSGGLVSVLLGLSWGGNDGHPWKSASVIAPIIFGGLGLIASFAYDFVIVEKSGRHALFPRNMMTRFREFTVSLVVVFIAGMVYYSMSALLPQATQLVYTNDPLQIGILMLPNGIGQMVATCFVPLLLHKTGYPTRYCIGAVFLQTLFTGLYALGISGHKAAWVAFQFFGAGPFGLITVTTVFNVGLHVRPSELGVAVGLLGTFRSMGGSVGNAVFNTILRSVASEELPKQIAAAALTHGFKGDLSLLIPAVIATGNGVPNALAAVQGATLPIEAATMLAFRDAYAQAFKMVFYSTVPFGVIALVASCFIKDATPYMTNHIHVHLVKDVLHRGVPSEQKAAREVGRA